QHACDGSRRHADGQRLSHASAAARHRQLEPLRRQHRSDAAVIRRGAAIGSALAIVWAALLTAAGSDTRVADAAMRGDRDAVKALLKQAADVNSAQGDGMTALHWAASRDDVEMLQTLVYAGANLRATTRLGGVTPLWMAAQNGSPRA